MSEFELSGEQIAAYDQEHARAVTMLDWLIDKYREKLADHHPVFIAAGLAGELAESDATSVASVLAVAVERLAAAAGPNSVLDGT